MDTCPDTSTENILINWRRHFCLRSLGCRWQAVPGGCREASAVSPAWALSEASLPFGRDGAWGEDAHRTVFIWHLALSLANGAATAALLKASREHSVERWERTSRPPAGSSTFYWETWAQQKLLSAILISRMGCRFILSSPCNSITTGASVPYRRASHCSEHLHFPCFSLLRLLTPGDTVWFEDSELGWGMATLKTGQNWGSLAQPEDRSGETSGASWSTCGPPAMTALPTLEYTDIRYVPDFVNCEMMTSILYLLIKMTALKKIYMLLWKLHKQQKRELLLLLFIFLWSLITNFSTRKIWTPVKICIVFLESSSPQIWKILRAVSWPVFTRWRNPF